jgi:hypothetical protein
MTERVASAHTASGFMRLMVRSFAALHELNLSAIK